jgi:hypothetical protein
VRLLGAITGHPAELELLFSRDHFGKTALRKSE